MSAEYPLFALSEEHQEIRKAIREICDAKIAPAAAAVDEEARYPQEAHDALVETEFFAPHVPEAYGGVGADALATVLVIEEIARADVSASLIPAVNKLGSLPVQIGGSEELRRSTSQARGRRGQLLLLPLRARRRLGRRQPEDPGRTRRRLLGAQRRQALDHQRGCLGVLHRARRHRPEKRSKGISAFVVEKSDEGVSFGAPEKKLGIKGSPTREVYFDNVCIPADRLIGEEGLGFTYAMQTLDHTRITIAAQAVGVAQGALDYALGYIKERKQFGKPIAEFQGVEFMVADMGMKIEAARQLTYAAAGRSERGDKDLTFFGAAAKAFASDVAMQVTTDAVQLLGGYGFTRDYPVEADDARRQDHPDL